jgi:hypothetical protein
MRQLAESSSLRNNLTAAGLERSQTFTWPKAAERSMEYFSKLAGQRR